MYDTHRQLDFIMSNFYLYANILFSVQEKCDFFMDKKQQSG